MNEDTDNLKKTIEHMRTLPGKWDYNRANDDWEAGYSKGWIAALESLASRMGVDL